VEIHECRMRCLLCNLSKLSSEIKCFILLFLRALRVLRGEAVLHLYTSVRVLAFDPFSLVTHSE